jgi:hypothetical protein
MGAPRPGDDPPSGTTAVVPTHWRRMGLIRTFKKLSLSVKLIASYLVILGVGGLAITVVGSYIVSSTIMAEAERTVKHDLAIARAIYQQEIRVLQRTVEVAAASPFPSCSRPGTPSASWTTSRTSGATTGWTS